MKRDPRYTAAFIKRAAGSPEEGEVTPQQEQPTTDQGPRASAADTLKKLGLSVARGVPQIVTGAVDLAAMPFTLSGMLKPEQVMGSTEYLTKRGLLPPPQPGVVNETAELVSSAVNPAAAVKGSAAAALGMMKNAGAKTLAKQLDLPFGEAAKAAPEAPMIRAYTGHTREIVGPYDMSRAARTADMGPGLYLTDNAEYASSSATKRLGKTVSETEAAPAVYPLDLVKDKILLHDRQYPREVLDKLRNFSKKVEDVEGPTVSGEYLYEQIRKAGFPKTYLPDIIKLMGFQGAEFTPGGVSKGRSYVIYDTANTAKGAFNQKKFAEGGEVAKVSDEDVRTYLKNNTALTDKEIAGLMQQYDVSKSQISRVTGVSMPEVERRYREATATTARPTVEGIGALWNKLHEKEFGAPVNLATAGRENVDRQVGELQTEAARQQAEWDKKFGKTPAPIPTWGDTYNAWAPLYEQRFGTMINRPWNADVDAQTQKLALDQQYIQAVRDYNTKHGTNYAPEESVLGVNAQPNVYFYAPEKSNKGVKTLLSAAGTLAGMYLFPGMDPGNMATRALITAGTEGAKRLFNEGGEVREEGSRWEVRRRHLRGRRREPGQFPRHERRALQRHTDEKVF